MSDEYSRRISTRPFLVSLLLIKLQLPTKIQALTRRIGTFTELGVEFVQKHLEALELESEVIEEQIAPSIVSGFEFEMRAIESGVE